jgi:hypothetical protein
MGFGFSFVAPVGTFLYGSKPTLQNGCKIIMEVLWEIRGCKTLLILKEKTLGYHGRAMQ